MDDPLYPHHDFEAVIRIYTPDEGGRRTPAFNGIRWAFEYADDHACDQKGLYDIWPDFCDADGKSLPDSLPLPVGVKLPARMMVMRDELRAAVHRDRVVPGVRFFCYEGRRVAEGVVTRITGLFTPRSDEQG